MLGLPAFISGGTAPPPQQKAGGAAQGGIFDPVSGQILPPNVLQGNLDYANRLLQEGSDASPVRSWTQGMARVAEGLVGGYESKKAMNDYSAAMQAGQQSGAAMLSSIFGGGGGQGASISTPTPSSTSDATVTPGQPTGACP